MALQLPDAIRNGFRRARTRNGFVLVVAYLVASLLQFGLVLLVTTTYLPLNPGVSPQPASGAPMPGSQLPALVSAPAALLGAVTGGFLTIPVRVVAIRTFAGRWDDHVPDELVFDRLGRATLTAFAVGFVNFLLLLVVASVCLGGGFLALAAVLDQATLASLVSRPLGWALLAGYGIVLLLPAAFVATAFAFVAEFVAAGDRGVVGALTGSWRLTRGNRLGVAALVVIPGIAQGLVGALTNYLPSPVVSNAAVAVESAVVGIVVLAVMTRAYVQLGGPIVERAE